MGLWLGGLKKEEWKTQGELLREKFGNNLEDSLEPEGLGIGVGVCWSCERFELSSKRGGSPFLDNKSLCFHRAAWQLCLVKHQCYHDFSPHQLPSAASSLTCGFSCEKCIALNIKVP